MKKKESGVNCISLTKLKVKMCVLGFGLDDHRGCCYDLLTKSTNSLPCTAV